MMPQSIAAINQLSSDEKRETYCRFIPRALLERFGISCNLEDDQGRSLLRLECEKGSTDVILDLRHEVGALDPLLYAHLTDTMHGQIHVLLYVVNDPVSERYDVDKMPDGTPTEFGSFQRNIPAETAAMKAGLAPGQVRPGLRILRHSIAAFESFVTSLDHNIYFIEPLYYHNAIVFERYGFAYQQGLSTMHQIHTGFQVGGSLHALLDGSSPFRQPGMERSILGRSWAIHDGILGVPFSDVTMYKHVGEQAEIMTFPGGEW
jgi:hypothetical protein